jgi:hypothetical protein
MSSGLGVCAAVIGEQSKTNRAAIRMTAIVTPALPIDHPDVIV